VKPLKEKRRFIQVLSGPRPATNPLPANSREVESDRQLGDNIDMSITAKKPAVKPDSHSRHDVAATPKEPAKRKASGKVPAGRARDAAQRKKVGAKLDMTAFLAHHKRNSASTPQVLRHKISPRHDNALE
jgi:hypothetical protein